MPLQKHDAPAALTCDSCAAAVPLPPELDYAPLWDAGWRWRGAEEKPARFAPRAFLVSCPDCPPVIGHPC